jgi:hypothetical protein
MLKIQGDLGVVKGPTSEPRCVLEVVIENKQRPASPAEFWRTYKARFGFCVIEAILIF